MKNIRKIILPMALAFVNATSSPVFADDQAYPRPITPEEHEKYCAQAHSLADFAILGVNDNNSNPSFLFLSCGTHEVSIENCDKLKDLLSLSRIIHDLQGGKSSKRQIELEERTYGQLGPSYERHCFLGF